MEGIPAEYKPLSPWAYFGYSILFSIPLVGFILLIVFSLDNSNINRRNFARSYWCTLILLVIIFIILIIFVSTIGNDVVDTSNFMFNFLK